MNHYKITFVRGDYRARQHVANSKQCDCYVEHHFNSSHNKKANYGLVIVGKRASKTSIRLGKVYAKKIAKEFKIKLGGNKGVLIGGYNGRGNGNIKHTRMPAVLLEPLFGSNEEQARIIRSSYGQDCLAKALSDSIKIIFPYGGHIAFSVGHKYKSSRPHDRGARLVGGGNEADFAEIILFKAKEILMEGRL